MLKDYVEPQLTLARVQTVIEAALEREDYGPHVSADIAAKAVFFYLSLTRLSGTMFWRRLRVS